MPMERDIELENLRRENARLKALLERHGIDWVGETPRTYDQEKSELVSFTAPALTPSSSSTSSMSIEEKVALFRGLFQGRPDVFARRWESNRGNSGYAPVCANEWVFFDTPIQASIARRLGTVMISQTCADRRQLELSSYDRLFPNQDRRRKVRARVYHGTPKRIE